MDNDRKPGAWKPAFLAALAKDGNIRGAARAAGITQTTAYDARERHPEFASAWATAIAGKEYRRGPRRAPIVVPEPVVAEPATPTRATHWRQHFLEALAETSSITLSAARAGVAVRKVYKAKREEPEFAARWLAALLEGYDHLELELLGYLRDPAPARKMDVAAALRLLAAHRDTVERRRALEGEEDEQAVRERIDAFLEGLRQRRLANEAVLIEKDAGDVAR